MANKIKVLRKKPGGLPEMIEIENTLSAFQHEVGGYIEVLTCASDAAVVCNEEGLLLGLKPNCTILGTPFVGTILIAGVAGEDFTDLSDEKFWIKAITLFGTTGEGSGNDEKEDED